MADLGLLVTLVDYLGDHLMPHEIYDNNLVPTAFKDHDIEVVPTLNVLSVGSSKRTYPTLMLILLTDSTIHRWILPHMNTLSNVGLVTCVLEVVD